MKPAARIVGPLCLLLLAASAHGQGRGFGAAGTATRYTVTDTVTSQLGYDVSVLAPNKSTAGKTPSISATISSSTFVMIGVGDSLQTNISATTYTPSNVAAVQNLNLYDGLIYKGIDPLISTPLAGGNYLTRTADKLVSDGKFARVVIIPLALGGSTSLDWSTAGVHHQRARVACWMVRDFGWIGNASVKFGIVYGVGTNDQTAGSTSQQIQDRYNSFRTAMTGHGCDFDTFVHTQSRLASVTSATVTGAQAAVVDSVRTFTGVNIDTLTGVGANSTDGTHLDTATGSAAGGNALATLIEAHY